MLLIHGQSNHYSFCKQLGNIVSFMIFWIANCILFSWACFQRTFVGVDFFKIYQEVYLRTDDPRVSNIVRFSDAIGELKVEVYLILMFYWKSKYLFLSRLNILSLLQYGNNWQNCNRLCQFHGKASYLKRNINFARTKERKKGAQRL